MTKPDQRLVTVCASCMRACCWQGEFYCDNYKGAGTTRKTVAELRAGNYGESEHYWGIPEQEGASQTLPDRAQRGTPTPSLPTRERELEEALRRLSVSKTHDTGGYGGRQVHTGWYCALCNQSWGRWAKSEQHSLDCILSPPTDSGGG
jgi:hypothetical protein